MTSIYVFFAVLKRIGYDMGNSADLPYD